MSWLVFVDLAEFLIRLKIRFYSLVHRIFVEILFVIELYRVVNGSPESGLIIKPFFWNPIEVYEIVVLQESCNPGNLNTTMKIFVVFGSEDKLVRFCHYFSFVTL